MSGTVNRDVENMYYDQAVAIFFGLGVEFCRVCFGVVGARCTKENAVDSSAVLSCRHYAVSPVLINEARVVLTQTGKADNASTLDMFLRCT